MNMIFILKKKSLLWRWKFIIIKFNFIAGIELKDYIKYKYEFLFYELLYIYLILGNMILYELKKEKLQN